MNTYPFNFRMGLFLFIVISISGYAQGSSIPQWLAVKDDSAVVKKSKLTQRPPVGQLIFEPAMLWQVDSLGANTIHLMSQLPSPDGELIDIYLKEDSIFEPELQLKFPNIRTYQIMSQNGEFIGRLTRGPSGINGFYQHEKKWVRVKPHKSKNKDLYKSQYASEVKSSEELSCGVHDHGDPKKQLKSFSKISQAISGTSSTLASTLISSGDEIKTYRMAMATTAEYFQDVVANSGDTTSTDTEIVMENITTLLNEANAIYLIELSLRFELVANNDAILFNDTDTDGYSNEGSPDLSVNQSNLDTIIGADNYDIGHVIGYYGGGLARLSSVCADGAKAEGASVNNLGVFTHEIGHMLGSPHTFNGTEGFCGDNIGLPYEPGSGSTIMSYFGLCGSQNLSGIEDQNFHVGSLVIMRNFMDEGTGSTCGTMEANNNSIPTADAGFDYTIPARTPFRLNGVSADTDGDQVTHLWEQYETNGTPSTRQTMSVDDGRRALFRTIVDVAETDRYFPNFESVLNGSSELGESLPTTSRTLNMSFTARDRKGGVATDTAQINTVATKYGFSIISPNQNEPWNLTQPLVLRWNMGKSDQEAVACNEIIVELRQEGNSDFQTLQTNVTNDGITTLSGSEVDVLEENQNYRLRLSCPENVFYTLSTQAFTVVNEFPTGDSDWDGMSDSFEQLHGFDIDDPADAFLDADIDGYSNLEESILGLHPFRKDTDHDGTPDLIEISQETDPKDILSRITVSSNTEGFESETSVFNNVQSTFERVSEQAYAGSFSGASTNTTDSSASSYALTVSSSIDVAYSFYYKVSSEGTYDFLNFYINGERQERWSGEVDWSFFEGQLAPGDWTLVWEYAKDFSISNGDDKAWIDNVFISAETELSRPSGDNRQFDVEFSTGLPGNWSNGSTPWVIDEQEGSGDSASLASADIADDESSGVSLTAYFGAQTASFAYKVSSEPSYDFLNFYINDVLQAQWSGELDWQEHSFELTEGTHTLRWEYTKDFSQDGGQDKAWIDNVSYVSTTPNLAAGIAADFDADATSELLLRSVSQARTYYTQSGDSFAISFNFGRTTDIPVTGDFDGDGYADIALRRPSNGFWYIDNSSGIDIITQNSDARTRKLFGELSEDIPVVGDFDGDGISDLAVRRPSNQTWYILNSSGRDRLTGNTDGISDRRFGLNSSDIPVVADYDGDGITDIAVRRPSTQYWYILNSSGIDPIDGNSDGISRVVFGRQSSDIPVVADFDGDGRADIAVRRPSSSYFYIRNSSGQDLITGNADGITRLRFGLQSTDIPFAGDFDADGRADVSVYRPATGQWYIKVSSGQSRTSSDDIERWRFGDVNSIPILAPISQVMTRMAELND